MGKIIVIEGLDGCGKSTQLDLLSKTLTDSKIVSFPNYEAPTGKLIKEFLAGKVSANRYVAASLYAADRYNSYMSDWQHDYLAGKTIICGRYTTSNMIYQGASIIHDKQAFTEFISWLESYEYSLLGIPRPDTVIYLDMPLAKAQELLTKRYNGDVSKKDIYESNFQFMQACEEAAHSLAVSKGWHVISCIDEHGNIRTAQDIHKMILNTI